MSFRRGQKSISSTFLNDAQSVIDVYKQGRLSGSPTPADFDSFREDGKKIWLKVSGADFNRYDVLPIKGPLGATPTAAGSAQWQGITGLPINDAEYRKLNYWQEGTSTFNGAGTGIGSSHTLFAVLLDKIKSGQIGLAKISGFFARDITVKYAHHRYARMSARSPNAIESALSGPFRIWARHNNLGGTYPRTEPCVLEVNAYPAGQIFTGKSNAAIALNATNGSVSVWDCYGGTWADTGEDIEVTNRYGAISASGKAVAFTIPEGCNYYDLIQGAC